MKYRLVAYAPNGARLGPLPSTLTWSASQPHNEIAGAAELTYSRKAVQGKILGRTLSQGLEVALEALSGSGWAEVRNGRYLALKRTGDRVDASDTVSLTCPGYGWLTTKIRSLNESALLPESADQSVAGKRPFLNANAGIIIGTLLNEYQARGGATIARTWDTAKDSNGNNWSKTITIHYEHGIQLDVVLANLVAQGVVDVHWQGREMVLTNPDSTTQDLSGSVILRDGRDVAAAPWEETIEELVSVMSLQGGGDLGTVSETSTSAPTPWGRWEGFDSNESITTAGTAASFIQNELARAGRLRGQYLRDLTESSPHVPGMSIKAGDWITAPTHVKAERVRVASVQVRADAQAVTATLTLNDSLLDRELRRAKQERGIVGGSTGGSNIKPAPEGPDKRVPAKPLGLVVSSTAYINRLGYARALINANWQPVSTARAADGGGAMDISQYYIWVRENVTGKPWKRLETVVAATGSVDNLDVDAGYQVRVQAIGTYATAPGEFSDIVTLTTAKDVTPPPVPAKLELTTRLGTINVFMSGIGAQGEAMPSDYRFTEFSMSSSSLTNPPSSAVVDRIYGRGSKVITGQPYGQMRYFRARTVDGSGNRSGWSEEASIATEALVDGDLIETTINEAIAGANDRLDDLYYDVIPGVSGQASAAAQAAADALAAAGAAQTAAQEYADKQIANKINLIDNPSRTGQIGRWASSSAADMSIVKRPIFGVDSDVLQVRNSADNQALSAGRNSELFDVDPTKAYQFSVLLEDEKLVSGTQLYFGLNVFGNEHVSSINITQVVADDPSTTSLTSNPYFWFGNATVPIGGFRRFVAYLMPAGTDPMDMKALGLNVTSNMIMRADARKARMRVLNWGNGTGARDIWIGHPTVSEVDPQAVISIAKNVAATQAAQAAADAAASAASAANSVALTADKRITNSTVDPSTVSGYPPNAIWQRWSGTTLIGVWRLILGTWTPQVLPAPGATPYFPKIDLGDATVGNLNGQRIQARTLLAESLAIGRRNNLIPNGQLEWGTLDNWGTYLNLVTDVPAGTNLKHAVQTKTTSQGTSGASLNQTWIIEPDEEYAFEIWLKADRVGSRIYLEMRDQDSNHAFDSIAVDGEPHAGGTSYPVNNQVVPTTWTKYSGILKPRLSTSREVRVGSIYWNHPNGTVPAIQSMTGLRLIPRTGAILLEDGAVTTPKLFVDEGMVNTLKGKFAAFDTGVFNWVKANDIEAGAVRAQHLALGVQDGMEITPSSIRGWDADGQLWLRLERGVSTLIISDNIRTGRQSQPHIRMQNTLADTGYPGMDFLRGTEISGGGAARILLRPLESGGGELALQSSENPSTPGAFHNVRIDRGLEIWSNSDQNYAFRIGDLGQGLPRWNMEINRFGHINWNMGVGGTIPLIVPDRGKIHVVAPSGGNIFGSEYLSSDGHHYFQSNAIYYRTSTGSANVYVDGGGRVRRSTSLRAAKFDIEHDIHDSILDAVKRLQPVTFKDVGSRDRGEDTPTILGFIAEEVEETRGDGFVTYDENGDLSGVAYDRIPAALVVWLQDHERRLTTIEEKR